jgi:hypothetical protein
MLELVVMSYTYARFTRDRSRCAAFVGIASLSLLGLAVASCSNTSNGGQNGSGDTNAHHTSTADAGSSQVACDDSNPCASGTCCSSVCVDTTQDPGNCGSCGSACSNGQFCTASACTDATFANVCANGAIDVVQDAYDTDNQAGSSIGQALASCNGGGAGMSTIGQTANVLVPDGDGGARPNAGGATTLVAGGGWWGQGTVAYMDQNGLTGVYFTNDGTTSTIYQRSTGGTVASVADSALDAGHDYFLVVFAVEPQSGTPCLFAEGIYGPGTVAAGYYVSTQMIPNRNSYGDSWYVYEWKDTNSNGSPDSGDAFNLAASGR